MIPIASSVGKTEHSSSDRISFSKPHKQANISTNSWRNDRLSSWIESNGCYFEKKNIIPKNTKFSHSRIQPPKCRFSFEILMGSLKFDIVAAILNSTQQLSCIIITSIHPWDFVQMASNNPFDYHYGLYWLPLSCIILSQTCFKLWKWWQWK